jgi:hypothetical protein
MISLLDNITEEHIHSDPYTYLTASGVLKPGYYKDLAAHFPDIPAILQKAGPGSGIEKLNENNILTHISGLAAFVEGTLIHPIWKDFMRFHHSADFFHQIISHLGDSIRQSYPDLEQRLGKSLDELTVQPRKLEYQGADILIDIQFSINTPVLEASRVRSHHVDDPKKLFAGLFYMRAPNDDSIGGDLEISRWRGRPEFKNTYVPGQQIDNTHIYDDQVDLVNTVKYCENTLIIFTNSPYAVHGVSERQPTPHLRRYINLIAEFSEPLYDIKQYQNSSIPWALMRGNK